MNTSLIQVSKFGKALYYPYIHIQDENWLKLALLYWDGLYRIVPQSVLLSDSPAVQQAVNEGLLENIHPDEQYTAGADERFEDYLFKPLTNRLSRLLGETIGKIIPAFFQSNDSDIDLIRKIKETDSYREIYSEKLSIGMLGELERMGVARRQGDFIQVSHFAARLYMLCLAVEISQKIQASPVTNEPDYGAIGEYLSFGSFSRKPSRKLTPNNQNSNEFPSIVLRLGIDFPTPQSLTEVPMLRILRHREQHKDERKRFRQAIESITSTANTISDPNALADFFNQQREEIGAALNEHRKTLDELNVKTVSSLFGVSAPTAIAAAAGLAVSPVAMALTGTGIAVSLVQWWAEVRGQRREKIKGCPWHYLLSVKRFT